MPRENYIAQVELLLDCLPVLKNQNVFAMKGGTAINFFIKDLPRLSVDIDLTFLDSSLDRNKAISSIGEGLLMISERIKGRNGKYKIRELRTKEGQLHKLLVANHKTKIKIEPNFIMRGVLNQLNYASICKSIEERFAYSVNDIPLVSTDELYAGKICAALSRQHPRDFFDLQVLMETSGLTRNILSAFVIYLACSPRPMHELLSPRMNLNETIYHNEFVNMTEHNISFESLVETRDKIIQEVNHGLTADERSFLISLKEGAPKYELMPFKNLSELPALKWKLFNILKMDKDKRKVMLNNLINSLTVK